MGEGESVKRRDLREIAREHATPVEGGAAAVWFPAAELVPWADNPRFNAPEHVAQVVASIRRFGWGAPVIVNARDGTLAAGHSRTLAARELGMLLVPVRFMDLEPEEAELLALADNRLTETGRWDDRKLAEVLVRHRDRDREALKVAGFEAQVVAAHIRQAAKEAAVLARGGEDVDVDPTLGEQFRAKHGVELGQVWAFEGRAGEHRMLVGDCTSTERVSLLMGEERADSAWTDPPYGVAYKAKAGSIFNDDLPVAEHRAFLARMGAAMVGALEPGAATYWAGPAGPPIQQMVLAMSDAGIALKQQLVWVKDQFVLGHSDYHYRHEVILYGRTPGAGRMGRSSARWWGDNTADSVFEVPRPKRSAEHPTMKPVDLIRPMIENSTPPGGLVYEPFLGSGSTMAAAELSAMRCYGLEIDPNYAAVVVDRMIRMGCKATLQQA